MRDLYQLDGEDAEQRLTKREESSLHRLNLLLRDSRGGGRCNRGRERGKREGIDLAEDESEGVGMWDHDAEELESVKLEIVERLIDERLGKEHDLHEEDMQGKIQDRQREVGQGLEMRVC
jgi:hypothetical protein